MPIWLTNLDFSHVFMVKYKLKKVHDLIKIKGYRSRSIYVLHAIHIFWG